ncbi:MAG: SMC-Scp complex subunit ScpB [Planctomycetota bacterium]
MTQQDTTETAGSTAVLGLHARDTPLWAAVEAILATTDKPVPVGSIRSAVTEAGLGEPAADDVHAAVGHLNEHYEHAGSALQAVKIAGGYRLMTRQSFAGVLAAFHGVRQAQGLSRPAIETLAVVAYRQPITRAEIEAIRGVSSGEVLRSLIERKLVTIAGRAEELGRPMLYATTKEFLESFGLASPADLPEVEGTEPDTLLVEINNEPAAATPSTTESPEPATEDAP